MEEKKRFLDNRINENKRIEVDIQSSERIIATERERNKQIALAIENLEADVEILKNQLSAFASDLNQKRNRYNILSQELIRKKERLNAAQNKYKNREKKLESEARLVDDFDQQTVNAEEGLKEREKEMIETEKKIRQRKDTLFKFTQELFKLREHEANLYSEIQGNMAACRNLQAHINKLNQEFQRQQELLYNAEYQKQLMERKVQRARGERTTEEKEDLERECNVARIALEEKQKEHKLLAESVRKLDDELRAVEKAMESIVEERGKLETSVQELVLENDMTAQDLAKIVKVKEETLVQHDIMKLEIKNIRDTLMKATHKVYTLENRKYQLEMR